MPYLAKIIESIVGVNAKQELYEHMFYFGYFRNQLGLFGFESYTRYYKKLRRPRVVPIAAIHRLEELDLFSHVPQSLQLRDVSV